MVGVGARWKACDSPIASHRRSADVYDIVGEPVLISELGMEEGTAELTVGGNSPLIWDGEGLEVDTPFTTRGKGVGGRALDTVVDGILDSTVSGDEHREERGLTLEGLGYRGSWKNWISDKFHKVTLYIPMVTGHDKSAVTPHDSRDILMGNPRDFP